MIPRVGDAGHVPIPIQAAMGAKIIACETVQAFRKGVAIAALKVDV